MKIYIKFFKEESESVVNMWSEHLKQQIAETVQLIAQQQNNDPHAWQDVFMFPFMMQEDTHAKWLVKNDERYFLIPPYYTILFCWERCDFDGETANPFDLYLKESGLASEENVAIPNGFKYLGSYNHLQQGEPQLPGLVFDPEHEEGEVLADCMF